MLASTVMLIKKTVLYSYGAAFLLNARDHINFYISAGTNYLIRLYQVALNQTFPLFHPQSSLGSLLGVGLRKSLANLEAAARQGFKGRLPLKNPHFSIHKINYLTIMIVLKIWYMTKSH